MCTAKGKRVCSYVLKCAQMCSYAHACLHKHAQFSNSSFSNKNKTRS